MPSFNKLTDEELLSLIREDEEAFTEIYNRYWKKLLAIAYNHTKDKSAAEEIVQEVFISLWNKRGEVEIKVLSAYLATCIKFSVFKMLHKLKRHKEIIESNYQVVPFSLDEGKIYAKFLKEYIDGIVEQLPEKCQMVFRYSREACLTIPEIATKMDIAEKTVEAHLTKALKVVRQNLKESGIILVLLENYFKL